jgi:hypothetical protein
MPFARRPIIQHRPTSTSKRPTAALQPLRTTLRGRRRPPQRRGAPPSDFVQWRRPSVVEQSPAQGREKMQHEMPAHNSPLERGGLVAAPGRTADHQNPKGLFLQHLNPLAPATRQPPRLSGAAAARCHSLLQARTKGLQRGRLLHGLRRRLKGQHSLILSFIRRPESIRGCLPSPRCAPRTPCRPPRSAAVRSPQAPAMLAQARTTLPARAIAPLAR